MTKKTATTGTPLKDTPTKTPSNDDAAMDIIGILKNYDADQQNVIIGKVVRETKIHRKEMYDNHRSGAEYYGQSIDNLLKILSVNE